MWHVWRKGEVCTRFWWGNLRERDHWGDQDVDGWVTLTFTFTKFHESPSCRSQVVPCERTNKRDEANRRLSRFCEKRPEISKLYLTGVTAPSHLVENMSNFYVTREDLARLLAFRRFWWKEHIMERLFSSVSRCVLSQKWPNGLHRNFYKASLQ